MNLRLEFLSNAPEVVDGKRGYRTCNLTTGTDGFFQAKGLEDCIQSLLDAGHKQLVVEGGNGGPIYVGKL